MNYQLVMHIPSGEVYAVKWNKNRLIGMTHALSYRQFAGVDLSTLEYDTEDNEWYRNHKFRVMREQKG